MYLGGEGGGGGGVLISCITVVVRPLTLATPQCRDEARRVNTDQGNIAGTKREAPSGVRRVGETPVTTACPEGS